MKDEIVIDGVKYVRADSLEQTHGVNESSGVNRSGGVNLSHGVNRSEAVNRSEGVIECRGVNWSSCVTGCNGITWSNGVIKSSGVSGSNGVMKSSGVNDSYGVAESKGIHRSAFVSRQRAPSLLFNKPVDESRVTEVVNTLLKLLGNWRPNFNNIQKLYLANGSDWNLTPISEAKELSKEEAWADMPREAIEYLKSLPEFDAQVFFDVTGLKV